MPIYLSMIRPRCRYLLLTALFALLALPSPPATAAHGTFTEDDAGDTVYLPKGTAWILLSGTFGSGTATVEVLREDQTEWEPLKAYTAAPTYGGESWDFVGVPVLVRIVLTTSTSPSLYWQISPGAR